MEHKLIAFYEQTLGASEQREVEQWLAADPEHKKIYEDTITIWKNARVNTSYRFYNKAQAWEKLQEQIGAETAVPAVKGKVISLNWRKTLAIAASIAVVVVLGLWISNPAPQQFTAKAETETIRLKDNSEVTLYANAALQVAGDFNRRTRKVTLEGNAYFDIAKNPDKPFII